MSKYFFGLLLFVLVPCCHSSTPGVDVMHNCATAVRLMDGGDAPDADLINASKCVGMTEGVMDMLRQWEYFARQRHLTLTDTACFPTGMTIEQAVRVSYKYMQGHPEMLHAPGSGMIYLALTQAFPCKT